MTLNDIKIFAQAVRNVAEPPENALTKRRGLPDMPLIKRMCEENIQNHPECADFCSKILAAKDPAEVCKICDDPKTFEPQEPIPAVESRAIGLHSHATKSHKGD